MATWTCAAGSNQQPRGGIFLLVGLLVFGALRTAGGSVPSTDIPKIDLNLPMGREFFDSNGARSPSQSSMFQPQLMKGTLEANTRARLLVESLISNRGSILKPPELAQSASNPVTRDQEEDSEITSGRRGPKFEGAAQVDQDTPEVNTPLKKHLAQSQHAPEEASRTKQVEDGGRELEVHSDEDQRPGTRPPPPIRSNTGKKSGKMFAYPVVYPAFGARAVLVPPRPVYYYYAYPAVVRPVFPVSPTVLNIPVYVNVQPGPAPDPPPAVDDDLVRTGVQVTVSGGPATYGHGVGRSPHSASSGSYGLSYGPRYG